MCRPTSWRRRHDDDSAVKVGNDDTQTLPNKTPTGRGPVRIHPRATKLATHAATIVEGDPRQVSPVE